MKKLAIAMLLLSACTKSGAPAPEGNTAPTAAPAAPTAPAASVTDPAKLLGDETKVAAIAEFQKEMLPETIKSLKIARGAYQKGARTGDQMVDAAQKQGQVDTFTAANKAALAKHALTQQEVNAFEREASNYITALGLLKDAEEKNAGKPDSAALTKAQADQVEAEKQKLASKYGQAVVDNLVKHEADFAAVGKAQMQAALTP